MWQEFWMKNQMTVPKVTYLDVPKHSFQILWATAESNMIKNIFVHAFNIGIFLSIFLHLYLEIRFFEFLLTDGNQHKQLARSLNKYQLWRATQGNEDQVGHGQ